MYEILIKAVTAVILITLLIGCIKVAWMNLTNDEE